MDDRLPAHAAAVAGEVPRFAARAAPIGPGKAHRANRLVGAATGRTGDSGHGDRDRGLAARERTERHLARGFFAHGAMARERLAAHAEEFLLGGVRVGHEAALEPFGGSGDRGHRLRHPAAGAGLGGDELLARAPQALADGFRQGFHHAKKRCTAARTTSAYPAATRSSNMTPKPPP